MVRRTDQAQLRLRAWLVVASVAAWILLDCGFTLADEAIDFAHTLLLRRPVMEQELETQIRYQDRRDGREIGANVALDLTPLPRWQIELALPFLYTEPKDAPSAAGVGDLALENKFLLLVSPEHRALLSGGFDLRLPSGSTRRRLGGTTGITPFFVGGTKLGRIDLLADLSYQWLFNSAPAHDEQQVLAGLALAAPIRPWLTPFVELTTLTKVRGDDRDSRERLLRRPQVYLTPGLNFEVAPGRTLLLGVQLPTTPARTFDYEIRAGLVWDL